MLALMKKLKKMQELQKEMLEKQIVRIPKKLLKK